MSSGRTASAALGIVVLMVAGTVAAAAETFYAGADVSMLPEIEKAGGVYRDDGKETDTITVLRARGCNLFRVRLFVDPDPDFQKTDGATQDLTYVRALAKRIKAAGAAFLLDIHYSDRWADPSHQDTPRAWRDLDFDALERKVNEYTGSVLKDLADNGVAPEMVQVGNEIASGMLWPQGRIGGSKSPAEEQAQWARLARLINAGSRAVRDASTPQRRIRVVVHIHGGGRAGLPKWFLGKLHANPVDYDILALSFYPAWEDSLDALKQNMRDVVTDWGKDVLIAETSYAWKEMGGIKNRALMTWPMTPDGQAQFVRDLATAIKAVPSNKGIGFVWWYPEAIPVKSLHIWRNGAEGLFDEQGRPLPALKEFSATE
jgi:arabinogalactan endo-1,4-beta-galactosidase